MKTTGTRSLIFAVALVCAIALICTLSYAVAPDGKKTFTILHTNDMHTSFIGMGCPLIPMGTPDPYTPPK
jgi:2',3'-cyclic-nucleotide 2'-phosphodiesterase (5'-nucleotidase family)